MSERIGIADIGFERILMPGDQKLVQVQPQNLVRVERLFIERCENVILKDAKVGNLSQGTVDWSGVSTIFYSLPSSPKTIDRIRSLIREMESNDPPKEATRFVWDDEADPEVVMGLPVTWEAAEVGNIISLLFHNRGADPVRVTGVMRGKVAR